SRSLCRSPNGSRRNADQANSCGTSKAGGTNGSSTRPNVATVRQSNPRISPVRAVSPPLTWSARCRDLGDAGVAMTKLIYASNMSLDGYTEDETGAFDWAPPDDEVFEFITELMGSAGTYLYGRRMHETLAVWETDPPWPPGRTSWPTMPAPGR